MSNFGFKNAPNEQMFETQRQRGIVHNFPRAREFEQKVLECFEKAKRLYPEHADELQQLDRVPIIFFKAGRVAGRAAMAPTKIIFNIRCINIEFNAAMIQNDWDEMVNSTIPHEVAHIVDYLIHREIGGHDAKWKRIAIALGDKKAGERTHNMKVVRARKTKRFRYIAECGTELWFTTQMHNKVQRGSIRYVNKTGGRVDNTCFTGEQKVLE